MPIPSSAEASANETTAKSRARRPPVRPGPHRDGTRQPNSSLGARPGFGPGTLIATTEGELPVEWLTPGDRVITRDHGAQPLRWMGYDRITARQMADNPDLYPCRIEPDAFGPGAPDHPLLLSPRHRVLLRGSALELHFATSEAFGGAKHLAHPAADGLYQAGLTYFHLLFDAHQIVAANGLWCESLFAEPRTDSTTLATGNPAPARIRHAETARPCLTAWEIQLLHHLAPAGCEIANYRAA